jgi:thymidylate synthase ThyX
MRVTHVSLAPTQAAQNANRPALTPELLAATGARYSRSNDGLEAIISKIDPQNPDKSVDGIFKMIDYGHASIADMAPVSMFLDGVSMWLAYVVWGLCPTAGGQESSTRYIRLADDNLPDANEIGIPVERQNEWRATMKSALETYELAVNFWEQKAAEHPEVTRIPLELIEDQSEKAQKTVARMRRNYAFDRARYFLPAALKTNVMLIMSARAWVALCQQLLSHPLPEPQKLGELIRAELELVAPRLIKHATAKESFVEGWKYLSRRSSVIAPFGKVTGEASDKAFLEVFGPPNVDATLLDEAFYAALEYHDNRYAYLGPELQRTAVRFGWNAVSLGDMRDLNRHRTGTKWSNMVPVGFYGALDQSEENANLTEFQKIGVAASQSARTYMAKGDESNVYWSLLGTQFAFEHTTTADKFIYEAELRTGLGAHYRYAKHLHDCLSIWHEKFPESGALILEGEGEPE